MAPEGEGSLKAELLAPECNNAGNDITCESRIEKLLGLKDLQNTEDTGITNQWAWDGNSRLISQTDDNGNTTKFTYDALNRSVATQHPDGTAEFVGLVGVGDLQVPSGQPSLGGPASRTSAEPPVFIQTGYDHDDNVRIFTDANGTVQRCKYDGINRQVGCIIQPASGFGDNLNNNPLLLNPTVIAKS
ncbi:hypothetical protein HY009_09770, partial [Candidatus Acetothermia bacterium]|nr:hypothetical protein [Candidatus Acetothermia bacterium]